MSGEHEIAGLKRRLDALRPLTPNSLAAIAAWYDIELIYTSNAIEGNTLTRAETALVVEKGLTVGGKPLKDHLEALDHSDALSYVRALAAQEEPIREGDIREIHRLVLLRSNPAAAVSYSRHQRAIAGSPVRFPSPVEIAPLMHDFAGWLAGAPIGFASAFEAHYRLVTIHPFSDGNGRAARLLLNLMLLKAGYPPVVIGPLERLAYLESLQTNQLEGNAGPYRSFMLDRLRASLLRYVEHLELGRGGEAPDGRLTGQAR